MKDSSLKKIAWLIYSPFIITLVASLLFFPIKPSFAKTKAKSICPDWIQDQNNLPTCPEGGLVPETYPIGTVVISDQGVQEKGSRFTIEAVQRVIHASGEQNPLILLPVRKSTYRDVLTAIDNMDIDPKLKKKYKKSLLRVPSTGYTWQQDYFQSFANPKTGQPTLREVESYASYAKKSKANRSLSQDLSGILKVAQSCGLQKGLPLTHGDFQLRQGHFGGNIETLPAGICLLGDDHFLTRQEWETYADQVCNPGDDNRIIVPTYWLAVGHTDEIMKVVRNKRAKAPCDFSVVLASPKKALELLKKNPNEKFLNFKSNGKESISEIELRRLDQHDGLHGLCLEVIRNRQQRVKDPLSPTPSTVTKLYPILKIILPEARASLKVGTSEGAPLSSTPSECQNMTNGEVYHALTRNDNLRIFNELIQKEMDLLRTDIQKKLEKKLPRCEIDFIEVPDLFEGGFPYQKANGDFELPMGTALSILPNPTNAITINDTVISPDPGNQAFQNYMEEEYKKRGLKSETVDTFDYAHQGMGNLHCATNTIPICKPRGNK